MENKRLKEYIDEIKIFIVWTLMFGFFSAIFVAMGVVDFNVRSAFSIWVAGIIIFYMGVDILEFMYIGVLPVRELLSGGFLRSKTKKLLKESGGDPSKEIILYVRSRAVIWVIVASLVVILAVA